MRKSNALVLAAAALIIPLAMALGQGAAAQFTFRGIVKTPQGTPIPGATLTVGGKTIDVDPAGRFEFSGSASRTLTVIAEHSGFEVSVRVFEAKPGDTIEGDIILVPSPDCPREADANPPVGPLLATDFVEIETPTQLLAGFRVRIRADGEIIWRGAFSGGFAAFPGRAAVPKEDAGALIEKFRTRAFWSLCGIYYPTSKLRNSDGPLTYTTVQIGNQIRQVVDDYLSAPAFLRDLQRDFDVLANTERWWRPSKSSPTPPLVPSPGLTVDDVRRAWAGRNINAQDSSGWTPLMYATQFHSSPDSMKSILDAGANPNARSGIGETVLMFAVTAQQANPEWIRALIASGANVNDQDQEGRTALMLAVQRFALPDGGTPPEAISILRSAGARTEMRDTHGMSALDYFEQLARRASKYRQSDYENLRRVLIEP